MENILTDGQCLLPNTVLPSNFDGLNFDGLAGKRQNFPLYGSPPNLASTRTRTAIKLRMGYCTGVYICMSLSRHDNYRLIYS